MLFKSHLRSILNISPQSENEAESNVVPLYTGKTASDDTLLTTNDTPAQEEYDAPADDSNASRLEAENLAIREAKSRIETEDWQPKHASRPRPLQRKKPGHAPGQKHWLRMKPMHARSWKRDCVRLSRMA